MEDIENRSAKYPAGPVAARRRFMKGLDLWRWWQDWGRTALQPPVSAGVSDVPVGSGDSATWRPNGLYSQLTGHAMACRWEVLLNYGQYPAASEAALAALGELERWEDQLSVFRSHSEISRINRESFHHAVDVSDALWDILEAADNLWHLTEGAFDITSGSLSECWGFLKREGRLPNEAELAATMQSVGMDKVRLDSASRSLRFLHPAVQLNLGGIGKGWTLDRLVESLIGAGVADFAIHAGQSSVVARGRDGRSETGWRIAVTHPVYPDHSLGTLTLNNRAMGTSGSARQFIHYRGQRLSHIIDPRTGRPSTGVLSATVLAPTAAQADALGTACFVLGEAGCRRLAQQLPDLGILLVVPEGSQHRIVTLGDIESCWQPES